MPPASRPYTTEFKDVTYFPHYGPVMYAVRIVNIFEKKKKKKKNIYIYIYIYIYKISKTGNYSTIQGPLLYNTIV